MNVGVCVRESVRARACVCVCVCDRVHLPSSGDHVKGFAGGWLSPFGESLTVGTASSLSDICFLDDGEYSILYLPKECQYTCVYIITFRCRGPER